MRPDTTMQTLAALDPSFGVMGEQLGFDSVATQRYPEVERIEHVHHAGNWSGIVDGAASVLIRSEEPTSELQSLMRISFAVFCLYKHRYLKMHMQYMLIFTIL